MVHRINPETPRQNPTTAIGVQTAGRYCQVARVIPAATMNVSMMCLKIISVGLARKGKSGGSGLQDAAKAKGLEESRPQRNSGNIAPRDKSRMALAADRVKLLLLEAYPRVLPPQNQRSNEREPGGIRTPASATVARCYVAHYTTGPVRFLFSSRSCHCACAHTQRYNARLRAQIGKAPSC